MKKGEKRFKNIALRYEFAVKDWYYTHLIIIIKECVHFFKAHNC